jgi:hypothetical protein
MVLCVPRLNWFLRLTQFKVALTGIAPLSVLYVDKSVPVLTLYTC